MSNNATAVQKFTSRINTNNTDLNSILETINNLPDANNSDSSNSYETCNVNVDINPSTIPYQIMYSIINDSGKLEVLTTEDLAGETNIVCVKGTPITIAATTGGSYEPIINGDSSNDGVHFNQYQYTKNDTVIFGVYWIDCETEVTDASIGMTFSLSLD